MNKEIIKIIKNIRSYENEELCLIILSQKENKALLNYITNLQEENKFLKLDNPEMNIEHFRIIKENKRKIDNLREENERLNKDLETAINICNQRQKEIARLNNIINELKKN